MKIVDYEEKFGEVKFPEGFEETIKGLPIEEQMKHYRTTGHYSYSSTGWGERTLETGYKKLDEDEDVVALIVKDGLLVGAVIRDNDGFGRKCLAEKSVITYYACDNNGAGYNERTDYKYLLCVPENFEEKQ